jgi:predicted RND superfamily exporter protein
VTPEDLPEQARQFFYRETPAGPRYLLRVYPSGHVEDTEFAPKFLSETRSVDPVVTGFPVNFYEFAIVMQDDFRLASVYAMAAILLLLFFDLAYRRDIALAIVPLVMGGVWMVGSMNLLGFDYNLANIMAIPLIVGIGVAYGVYVIHRVREDSPPRPRQVVATTGKAVVFSALTTMVSFGAMGVASHRGAASLGQTLLIGIGACLVTALAVLPAIARVVPDPARKGKSG